MSQACVAKWGNSLAIRIPKRMADAAGWKAGDLVELDQLNDTVTVKKARSIKSYKLSETMGSYHTADEAGLDWGSPQGREVW